MKYNIFVQSSKINLEQWGPSMMAACVVIQGVSHWNGGK